jgi:hypothetical protein
MQIREDVGREEGSYEGRKRQTKERRKGGIKQVREEGRE